MGRVRGKKGSGTEFSGRTRGKRVGYDVRCKKAASTGMGRLRSNGSGQT